MAPQHRPSATKPARSSCRASIIGSTARYRWLDCGSPPVAALSVPADTSEWASAANFSTSSTKYSLCAAAAAASGVSPTLTSSVISNVAGSMVPKQ